MKFKMLAGLALSTLLAASLSYAANDSDMIPADDMTTTAAADTMSGPASTDNLSGGQNQNQNNVMSSPGSATPENNIPSSTDNSNTGNTNDDMSADTATGDDDY